MQNHKSQFFHISFILIYQIYYIHIYLFSFKKIIILTILIIFFQFNILILYIQ